MRTKCVWLVLVMFSVFGFATQASAADRLGSYLAIKGGIYSPSATFDLSNVDVETTFDGTTTFGVHAGVGLDVGITQNAFIGVEARYVWAEPSFGCRRTLRTPSTRKLPPHTRRMYARSS